MIDKHMVVEAISTSRRRPREARRRLGMTRRTRTTAASPTVPASSGIPSAATPEGSRSFWPISLSDIETYLSQIIRPMERKTEPRSRPPSERPVAEQPR
jgi:hypothetical protein